MHSLGNDLASLRARQGLSLEELQKQTRIALPILQSIEDDSIFSHLDDNTPYVRNYVRSYARTIGVEESKISNALDQVQRGDYQGLLQDQNVVPSVKNETPTAEDAPAKYSEAEPAGPLTDKKNAAKKLSPPAGYDSFNWENVHQPGRNSTSEFSKRKKLLIALLAIVCIAGAVLFYRFYDTRDAAKAGQTEQANQPSPPPPSDSLRQTLARGKSVRPAPKAGKPDGSMPDTLSVSVIAAHGNLQPIHVFTDISGKSNPYWVKSQDTVSFNFVNKLRIRAAKQYDRLQLVVNGKIIQNFYQKYFIQKTGSVEVNRSNLKSYFGDTSPTK